MTEQEAMEVLKQPCLCDYDLSNTVLDCDIKQCDKRDAVLQAIKALEEICQYREIGTPEECQAAIEKQIAKKPKKTESEGFRYTDTYRCPLCGGNFSGTGIADYCYHCGQKLDWSDEQ